MALIAQSTGLGRRIVTFLVALAAATPLLRAQPNIQRRQVLLSSKAALEHAIETYNSHIAQTEHLVALAQSSEAAAQRQGDSQQAAVDDQALSLGRKALTAAERYRADAELRLQAINAALAWPESESHSAVPLLLRGSVRLLDAQGHPLGSGATPLRPGDAVESGPDGYVELEFPSGARLSLGANTRFVYTESGKQSVYELLHGKLHALDSQFKNSRFGSRFEVRHPNAVVAVRGTEFSVDSSEDGTTYTVLSGAIDIRLKRDQPPISLSAGEQLHLPATGTGSSIATPVTIDPRALHTWWEN